MTIIKYIIILMFTVSSLYLMHAIYKYLKICTKYKTIETNVFKYDVIWKRITSTIEIIGDSYFTDPRFNSMPAMTVFNNIKDSVVDSVNKKDLEYLKYHNPNYDAFISLMIISNIYEAKRYYTYSDNNPFKSVFYEYNANDDRFNMEDDTNGDL